MTPAGQPAEGGARAGGEDRPPTPPAPPARRDGAAQPALAEERIAFAATAERLADLHAALERFWAAVDRSVPRPPDATWRQTFATAVAEIATNVIRHAYPGGGAAEHPDAIRLDLRAYPDRAEATFADRGVAYAAPETPTAPVGMPDTPVAGAVDPDDLLALAEGGYGLALARAAVDELDYERSADGINHWRLMKRF
jgi:serine/threonine-protein kinase RsbW